MSERARSPESRLTEAQVEALQDLCARYGVEYLEDHYWPQFDLPKGYVAGWIGGPTHANPQYQRPAEPAGKPTLFCGVDPEGRVSS